MLQADIAMEEGQTEEEEVGPEGMPSLENASLYIELGEKCNTDMQSEMLETMRSLKPDLEILKADNVKLMNSKSDQEEINKIILNFGRSTKKQCPKFLR